MEAARQSAAADRRKPAAACTSTGTGGRRDRVPDASAGGVAFPAFDVRARLVLNEGTAAAIDCAGPPYPHGPRGLLVTNLSGDLHHFATTILLAVGALIPIVDPLGGAPIYLVMTAGLTADERARMARTVAINSFLLLIASTFIGAYVLDFFAVSIPAVQVAGGAVVCSFGWSLLNGPVAPSTPDRGRSQADSAGALSRRAFYPMTLPLTVGPGSISVAVTLGANPPSGLRPLLLTALAHAVGVVIVAASVFLCYRYADRILKALGPTGTDVFMRLSAFILLCIGVQIAMTGLSGLLGTAPKQLIPP